MKPADFAAVETFAKKLLGTANVASITAASMQQRGENVEKIAALIEQYGQLPPETREYSIKKSAGEPNVPDDFAFFVRKR
jgi:hypothetical protein